MLFWMEEAMSSHSLEGYHMIGGLISRMFSCTVVCDST